LKSCGSGWEKEAAKCGGSLGFCLERGKREGKEIVNYCGRKGERKINNSSVSIWYIMWILYGKKK